MKRMDVGPYQDCVVLESGALRLAVTTREGPRVIFASIGAGPNLMAVLPRKPFQGDWFGYGGHRLWHAPEAALRTYAPDNEPVLLDTGHGDSIVVANRPEPSTGIEKRMELRPLGGERVEVVHTLTNRNLWAVTLAPWALSMMAPGGVAVFPLNRVPGASPFAVERSLHLWPYADFDDPRLTLGRQYILFRNDPQATSPCKIGLDCAAGWAAYVRGGDALVTRVAYDPGATYPDRGCNFESYSCADFHEVETLGPLTCLAPGASVVHVETWHGLRGLGPISDEASVARELLPRLG